MTDPAAAPRSPLVRVVIAAVLLAMLVLGLRAPLPAYVLRPGPVFPLADTIHIDGAEAINGEYLFTTVQLDDATIGSAIAAGFDDRARVVTRRAVLGDLSEEAFVVEQEALFAEAQALAVSLALDVVAPDLDVDDVIVDSGGVGGPSAGLLLALAVADLASPLDIAAGRSISGTGAVDEHGRVTAVGSLGDKLLAAEEAEVELFLVPRELLAEAEGTGTSLTLVPVTAIEDAIGALIGR